MRKQWLTAKRRAAFISPSERRDPTVVPACRLSLPAMRQSARSCEAGHGRPRSPERGTKTASPCAGSAASARGEGAAGRASAETRDEQRRLAPVDWRGRRRNGALGEWFAAQDRGQRGDVIAGLGRQRAARREVFVVASRTGIIGREHRADIAVAVEHLAQIGRARHDVVAHRKRVVAEAVAGAQFCPGIGHDLHQPHRAGR